MRSKVYRNLDRPFQILGLYPSEITALCLFFVVASEFSQSVGLNRVWIFLATAGLAAIVHWFRRIFGELFGRRLIRFLALPSEIRPQLFAIRRPS